MDNYKLLNFLNFNDVGSSSVQEMNAFKKIRMFSKTYTSNLVFVPNNYSSKYKTISNLYINDSLFTDSYLYGLKRQHNFLSANSTFNNQSTFLNLNSVNKFVNFNFKNNINFEIKTNQSNNLNFFKKNNNLSTTSNSLRINSIFNKLHSDNNLNFFNNSLSFSNFISSINYNSDKPKLNYPMYKLFNAKLKQNKFYNYGNLNKLNSYSDLSLLDSNDESKNFFLNNNLSYKTSSAFSQNQSVSLSNRFIRNFVTNSISTTNYNYSLNINTVNDYLKEANSSLAFNNNFFLNTSKLD